MKQFAFSALLILLQSLQLLQAQTYGFPFKGEDLDAGVRISTGNHAAGIQEQGRDIGAMRYLGNNNWTDRVDGKSTNNSNNNFVIYGQEFYAIADGEVCGCWRNAPENPKAHGTERHPDFDKKLIIGGGNHLWIKHSDGSYALYAHAIPGSIPASICPNNDILFKKAHSGYYGAPDIATEVLIPEGSRPKVKKGQLLGRVGNSGASSGPHLHLHVEKGGKAMPMKFDKGLYKTRNGFTAGINDWTSFSGKTLPAGSILVWPASTVGSEYTRFGYPIEDYQRMFDHLANSGFEPEWVNGYNVDGKIFLNFSWRPKSSTWRSFFGLSAAAYQAEFDKAKSAGLSPTHVDSYNGGGSARYNVIFKKVSGGYLARHGLQTAQHEAVIDEAKTKKLYPVCISVVSINNQLAYTVLYRAENIGSWQIKSQVEEDDYQALVNTNKSAGRMPLYLDGYKHNGKTYFSCVFASVVPSWKARHGMTANACQTEFNSAMSSGLRTRVITAFDGASSLHRYAAVWKK